MFTKAHMLTGGNHSHRDARRLRMEFDLLPHIQVLMVGQDRLNIPDRDSHHALDQLVGLEPGTTEPELRHPLPYPVRRSGDIDGPRVDRDSRRSELVARPGPRAFRWC